MQLVTVEDFDAAPVGTHVRYPNLPDTLVKRADGQWESARGGWRPASRVADGRWWQVVDGPIPYDDRIVHG